MTRRPAIASVLVAALVLAACSKKPADTIPAAAADLIITGGPIVTMEGDQPTTVEAIVVDDGKITFVGSKADALKQKAEGTVVKDLGGKTLMPGFIDGHAHAQQFGGQAVGANLLAPPDGNVNTIDDLVAKLKTFADGPDVEKTGWIFGVGYDDALLGRHPTREDLDKVSTTVPVMATHISGHFRGGQHARPEDDRIRRQHAQPRGRRHPPRGRRQDPERRARRTGRHAAHGEVPRARPRRRARTNS